MFALPESPHDRAPPLVRLIGKLFARPLSRRDRRRVARLGLEPLEARDVPAVAFTIEALADATEGGTAGQFRVTATGHASDFTNPVYAILGASGGTATYSADYTTNPAPTGNYLVFGSSGSSITITVSTVDDTDYEADETVGITVQRYQMFPSGSQYGGTLTLHDNDRPTVTVQEAAPAVEGVSPGKFRFSRTGVTTAALTVSYTVQDLGPGTATPGEDYATLSGSVTIPAGYASADVEVTAFIDLLDPGESVTVGVDESADYNVGAGGQASVPLIEDLSDPKIRTAVLNRYFAQLTQDTSNLSTDYADTLGQMQDELGDMETAYGANQLQAFNEANGRYGTLDLGRGTKLAYVVSLGSRIIVNLQDAATIAEGDAYRLKALRKIGNDFQTYVTDCRDRLENLLGRLEALGQASGITALEDYHYNLSEDWGYINILLGNYDSVSYSSDTESDDERVGDLNRISGDVDTALGVLGSRVIVISGEVTAILGVGQTVIDAPDEDTWWARLQVYAYENISPFDLGQNGEPGLFAYISEPVDAILALLAETDPEENPDADPSGIDITDEIKNDLEIPDACRLNGMIADLDKVLSYLDTVTGMLAALRAQNEIIGAMDSDDPELRRAPYWNTVAHLNDMDREIRDKRQEVQDVREEIERRLAP